MNTPRPILDFARFPAASPLGRALAWLQARPGPVYLVGGTVRDLLLGRPTHDIDVALSAGAMALARELADDLGGAFYPLDAGRDTGRAVLASPERDAAHVDSAALRAGSLEADLRLRDFTIDALALDLTRPGASVIDVAGGLDDLDRRLVRLASDHALQDDPVRCLRAVRLAAELRPWGFRLEDITSEQVRENAPLLAQVSAERVRDELLRILAAAEPDRWLRSLAELDMLPVVLPEAEALRGLAQSPPHRWDVFEHTAEALSRIAWLQAWLAGRADLTGPAEEALDGALAPFRPALLAHFAQSESAGRDRGELLRWAALCHDWGKPLSRTEEAQPDGAIRQRFFGHEQASAELTEARLRQLRFSEAEVRRATLIVAQHMRPHHLVLAGKAPSRRAVFRYFRATRDAGVDVALLSLADLWATQAPARAFERWQAHLALVARLLDDYFNRQETVAPPPLIGGRDLLAHFDLRPGPLIGRLLAETVEAQAAGELHTRDEALAYVTSLLDDMRNP